MELADRVFMWGLLVVCVILGYGLYEQKLRVAKLEAICHQEIEEERQEEERRERFKREEAFLITETW